MRSRRSPSPEAEALHQQLLDVSAHAEPVLAAVIHAVTGVHQPRAGRSINSLNCDLHNPNKHRDWRDPDVYDSCPDCVVTWFDICSCWACDEYPCKTLKPVLEALGIRADLQVSDMPASAEEPAPKIHNERTVQP